MFGINSANQQDTRTIRNIFKMENSDSDFDPKMAAAEVFETINNQVINILIFFEFHYNLH